MAISVPGALNADLAAGRSLTSVLRAPLPEGIETITLGISAAPETGGIALLVISIVGFFVRDAQGAMPTAYKIIWMGGAFAALGLFARVMILLSSFLRQV